MTSRGPHVVLDGIHDDCERELTEARAEIEQVKYALTDWEDEHRRVVADKCAGDEHHCSCVPSLRREIELLRTALREVHYVASLRSCPDNRTLNIYRIVGEALNEIHGGKDD